MKKLLLMFMVSVMLAANNPGDTLREMIDYVSKQSSNTVIANYIKKYVNTKSIAAEVAGRRVWLSASQNSKDVFIKKLSERLLNYYASNLSNLNRYRFEYTARNSSQRQTIKIYNPNGSTATLVVFYQQNNGQWMIIDSSYNGISIVSYWRAKLQPIIKSKGLAGI